MPPSSPSLSCLQKITPRSFSPPPLITRALLFITGSNLALSLSTASKMGHSAPAETPEHGGLSPPCLTHAILALTAQNNMITLAFFFFFSSILLSFYCSIFFPCSTVSPRSLSAALLLHVSFLQHEKGPCRSGQSHLNDLGLLLRPESSFKTEGRGETTPKAWIFVQPVLSVIDPLSGDLSSSLPAPFPRLALIYAPSEAATPRATLQTSASPLCTKSASSASS